MDLKQSFLDKGYIVVKNVLSKEEIDHLKDAMERLITKVNAAPHKYTTRYTRREEENSDTWGVNNIFQIGLYEEAFGNIFCNENLMGVIKELLGGDLRFWGAHALWSPQYTDYKLRWHRDYGDNHYFHPAGIPNHIQFNIPLYIDRCFVAIPGSHKRPLFNEELSEVETNGTNPLPGELVVPCDPGDVLFMNAHTLHRGECGTGTCRRTLHFSLQGKDEPYGAHTSNSEMRDKEYLARMNPVVRDLMTNLIRWDDAHPLSPSELLSKVRGKKERENYIADGN